MKRKYYFDGRYYQAKVRKSSNLSDGYITVRGKTIKELEEKVTQLNHERLNGRDLSKDMIVADWIRIWWRNREDSMSESLKSYRRPMINNVIGPAIGGMRISSVKPEHLQTIMTDCKHRSHSYCDKLKGLLNAIFKAAVENGLTLRNPAANLRATGKATPEKKALTVSQWQELKTAAFGTGAELFILLGYYTGMRREEICGLIWDNVHLETYPPYIAVEAATTWPKRTNAVWPSPLKTASSRRKIPIHAELLPVLSEAYGQRKSRFVIPGENDNPPSYYHYRTMIKSVVVSFAWTPHQLRHTFCTNLISAGMDIKKVQRLSGHSTVTVLLNIYSHCQASDTDLSNALNAAFK